MIEIVKLRDYCLNTEHPRGRHKARVFAAALALTGDHAEELRDIPFDAARTEDATLADGDEYGQRYIIDFIMTHEARQALIRSVWMVRSGETFP